MPRIKNTVIEEDIRFITSADLPWEALEGKKILVSGANGFLPAYMVESLLYLNDTKFRKKSKIYALVRNVKNAQKRFENYSERSDLVFIVQDVCSPLNIRGDINFIIHAASQASPKFYGKDPSGTISANTVGTYNLLELAKVKKTDSFLFFSSGEVYGKVSELDMPIAESTYGYLDPMSVRSCYAEGKRAGETMCSCWYHQYGVPAKIVRPFHIFGPKMKLDDGRVYADFVSDILHDNNIIIKSRGDASRTFCYLADATVGFFTVLLKGKNSEAYNVANKNGEISIRDLAHMLIKLFPEKKLTVEIKETVPEEGYIASRISRAHPQTDKIESLGWTPRYSLEEGFERTIRSYS